MTRILITGGCGFIGTNAAEFYLKKGYQVIVLDNLSRVGAKQNLSWLKNQGGDFVFKKIDIRKYSSLIKVFKEYKPDLILHLAGQTTVTGSIANPREDFEINALGTFNVLEAMRNEAPESPFLYSSTNKVMGELQEVAIQEEEKRYVYKDIESVSEKYPLNFCSPYGCSKGSGDQYVLDYARIYNLKTVVFRQSCIYGTRQFGIEGQGWLAWLVNAVVFNQQINLFGNGKQVRDILYIDDLVKAYDLAFNNIQRTKGKAYTIGGGVSFAVSVLEFLELLESISGQKITYDIKPWRLADQKVYISDVSSAKKDFNWVPETVPEEGIKTMYEWILKNKKLIVKSNIFNKTTNI